MASDYARLLIDLEANTRKFVGPMNQAVGAVTGIQSSLKSFGQSIATGFIAYKMMEFAKASVNAFRDFDQAMTSSAAILKDATGQMRSQMESLALTMSTKSEKSAQDLAKSYYYLASAGMNAKQSMAALPVVEEFATAGMFDMAKSTEMLMDSLSALGLKSKDPIKNMLEMTRLSDILVKANTLANATTEQFAESLTNKAAGALRLLNKDAEEGVAVLAAFAEQGVKGETAGQALAMVLRDLQKASIENAAVWEQMGINVYDAGGKMLRVADIIRQLEQKFGSMSDEGTKTAAMMMGFQERSFFAIQNLIGMSGKIDEFEAALRKAGGTSKDVAERQMSGFGAQMKEVGNQAKFAGISIGETLSPAVLALSKVAAEGIGILDSYIGRLEEVGKVAATETEKGFLGGMKTAIVGILALDPVLTPLLAHLFGPDVNSGDRKFNRMKQEIGEILDFVAEGTDPLNEFSKALSGEGEGEGAKSPIQEFIKKTKDEAIPAIDKLREAFNMLEDAADFKVITDAERVSGMAAAWKEYKDALPKSTDLQPIVEMQLQMERLQKQFELGGIDRPPYEAQMQALQDQLSGAQTEQSGKAGFVEAMKNMFTGLKQNQEALEQFNSDYQGFASQIMQETQSPFEKYMEYVGKLDTVLQAGMITANAYWQALSGAFADFQNSAGMQYMQQMTQNMMTMGQLVPSSGVQIMDIGASRFQAPGQAASMSASEASSMMGGGLADISKQQLTTQKSISSGINQMVFLLSRGLI